MRRVKQGHDLPISSLNRMRPPADVTEAVNDTLKAIAASLLMEQVLAPKFNFRPKNENKIPVDGYDYGDGGYDPTKTNIGFNEGQGIYDC